MVDFSIPLSYVCLVSIFMGSETVFMRSETVASF